jgi:hypothetical protein
MILIFVLGPRPRRSRTYWASTDEFFGVEDTALHNVDVMTDVSMAPTAFTRYTQAPSTTLSKKSKLSSRTKRKAERKVGSGRKGTVDEEEYLFKSVGKLVGRFIETRGTFSLSLFIVHFQSPRINFIYMSIYDSFFDTIFHC